VTIFDNILVTLDKQKLMKRLSIEQGSIEEEEFLSIVNEAAKLAKPKAIIEYLPIEKRCANILFARGIEFNSKIIADNINDNHMVLFAATCGTELSRVYIAEDDFLGVYWLEALKEEYLIKAVAFIRQHVKNERVFTKCIEFCPSDSGFWELNELKKVFHALGHGTTAIGIELGEYCFMTPGKSVAGILLNVHENFCSCDICDLRDKCQRKNDINYSCSN
jgi:hypothetical protein